MLSKEEILQAIQIAREKGWEIIRGEYVNGKSCCALTAILVSQDSRVNSTIEMSEMAHRLEEDPDYLLAFTRGFDGKMAPYDFPEAYHLGQEVARAVFDD